MEGNKCGARRNRVCISKALSLGRALVAHPPTHPQAMLQGITFSLSELSTHSHTKLFQGKVKTYEPFLCRLDSLFIFKNCFYFTKCVRLNELYLSILLLFSMFYTAYTNTPTGDLILYVID